MRKPGLIVLFGPTASGKSALALALAERLGGTVVNADSMQVYRELPVLTAQPDADVRARVSHQLYGELPAAEPCSVGLWLQQATEALAEASATGRAPVVTGGTGLYLEALLDGIAPVPDVPTELRAEARALDVAILRARLADLDPPAASLPDRQRLARAYEVVHATGRPLAWWQARPRDRLELPQPVLRLALLPPRQELAARIGGRFDAMLAAGAVEEVARLLSLGLDRRLPAMKAVGVPELAAHLRGEVSLDEARARAVAASRRYAKRQRTWLRGRMGDFAVLPDFGEAIDPEAALEYGRRRG